MSTRIRVAFGFGLLLSLVTVISVFAKGGFSFITITGPDLKETVRATDPALTNDFFAFADFYRARTEAPADPGVGYEITRYYIDGTRETAFDSLHYYPDTGYVYYDGIANGGGSEYDEKWYAAKPEIKTAFENALLGQTQSAAPAAAVEEKGPIPSRADKPIPQPQPLSSSPPSLPGIVIAVAAGLATLFAFAFWRRKPAQ